jgi:histidine phosphotransferase ChpT
MRRQEDALEALVLAEILTTRLCHDLSGQVNALTGAVEELQEGSAPDPEALGLANEAGTALVQRLRLARAAWGVASGPMSVEECRRLADCIPRRGVRLDLDGMSGAASFAPSAARLTLNVLMLAAECLPGGGVIEVHGQPELDLLVRIQGPRAAWPPGLAAMIGDSSAAMEMLRQSDPLTGARSMQAPLTALIAHATGQRISMLLGPNAEPAPPLLISLAPLH